MTALDELFKSESAPKSLYEQFGIAAPQKMSLSDVEQAALQNEENRALLASVGRTDPTIKRPNPLDRLFGILDTPGAGVRAVVYNMLNSPDDKDVSALREMGKALKGEDRIEGADILKDQGIDNKWAQMLGGFALDVLLDPTTYLTAGLSSFSKAEKLAKLAKIADTGLDAARISELGLDASKLSAPVREALEASGKALAGQFSKEDSRLIASAVSKLVGDAGGIKFMGQTILPVQEGLERLSYGAKDLARKTKPGEWFEKAFINGDFTSVTKQGNEVVNAGLKQALRKRNNAFRLAREGGAEVQRALEAAIPDEKVRNLVTFGIGRQFGDFADQGELRKLYDALEGAENPEVVREAIQAELGRLWAPQAVTDTLRAAGITDEATLSKVTEAVGNLQRKFDELSRLRGEKGLPNWTLYGKVDGAPASAGYVPGMSPLVTDKKAVRAQQAALDDLGLNVGELRAQDNSGFDFISRNKPSAYKSKEYVNAEVRMVEGGLLTETDIARLAGAKTKKDYADIALADFQEAILRMTGGEATPELTEFLAKSQRAFANDDAFKGFLGTYDKVLNMWKRWATVYNVPRFTMRNVAFSNKYLQWTENVLDVASERQSLTIMGKLLSGAELSKAEAAIVAEVQEQGVFTSAASLAEQVGGSMRRSRVKGVAAYEAFAAGLNTAGENQSRLSAYIAAKKRGLSPEAASLIVDKALYDYSPEAMTAFETNVMKRLVPFYTWVRRNTPHMAELLFKNPGKLTPVGHLKETGENVNPVDESVMPEWLDSIYPINTPIKSKSGNTIQIATEGVLPLGDLEKVAAVLTNPTRAPREFISNFSPLIKTPLELVMNHDIYYDENIAEYKGEKRRAPAYVEVFDDLASSVPGLSDLWDGVKGAFGIVEVTDTRTGEPYLKMDAKAAKAMRDLNPWFNAVGKTLNDSPRQAYDQFSYLTGLKAVMYDTDAFAEQQVYDDRTKLQGAIRAARSEELIQPKQKKKQTSLDDLFGR